MEDLVVSVSVDCCNEGAVDCEIFVKDFKDGSQTVCCARSYRDYFVFFLQDGVVDSRNNGCIGVFFAFYWGGNQNVFCAGFKVE